MSSGFFTILMYMALFALAIISKHPNILRLNSAWTKPSVCLEIVNPQGRTRHQLSWSGFSRADRIVVDHDRRNYVAFEIERHCVDLKLIASIIEKFLFIMLFKTVLFAFVLPSFRRLMEDSVRRVVQSAIRENMTNGSSSEADASSSNSVPCRFRVYARQQYESDFPVIEVQVLGRTPSSVVLVENDTVISEEGTDDWSDDEDSGNEYQLFEEVDEVSESDDSGIDLSVESSEPLAMVSNDNNDEIADCLVSVLEMIPT